jgi:hypothetical protein
MGSYLQSQAAPPYFLELWQQAQFLFQSILILVALFQNQYSLTNFSLDPQENMRNSEKKRVL